MSSARSKTGGGSRGGVSASPKAQCRDMSHVSTPVLGARKVNTATRNGTPAGKTPKSTSVADPQVGQRERSGPLQDEGNVLINFDLANCMPSQQPKNCVEDFFTDALKDPRRAVVIATIPRMDVIFYWEKRRIQNGLRRVLETVQERFGLEGDGQSSDLVGVFDCLAEHTARTQGSAGRPSGASSGGGSSNRGNGLGGSSSSSASPNGIALEENFLMRGLTALGLWPPELTARDRAEFLSTLFAPSCAAAKAALVDGERRQTLTRSAFCEGFDKVPFNLPDFPVPLHLLAPSLQPPLGAFTAEQKQAVASSVATTFSMEQTGLGCVKDFFLTGLISLEEVQVGLPRLVPHSLVEDAVVQIINRAAPLLSATEWQELVLQVRTKEACGHPKEDSGAPDGVVTTASAPPMSPHKAGRQDAASTSESQISNGPIPVSLESPSPQQRELRVTPSASPGNSGVDEDSFLRRRFEPMTEPLPCRQIREAPVSFAHSGTAAAPSRIVNWSTAARLSSRGNVVESRGGHQADEGAGGGVGDRHGSWSVKLELASVFKKAAEGDRKQASSDDVDRFAWINLGLHHECAGPFLAHAFARCCQLYGEHGLCAAEGK